MKNIARLPFRTLVLTLLLCLAVPLSAFAAGEIIVSADGSGQFTTITDAMNSITDASETNRYLITVKPGIYNEAVNMTSYVDLVGSGEGVTVITSVVSLAVGNSLKNLTVDNQSVASLGVSMTTGGEMDQVTVLSAGYGVTVGLNYEATIVDSTISASLIGAIVRGHLTLESSAVYGDTAIQMAALAPASLLMRNSTASGVTKGLEMTNMSGDAAIYDSVLAGPNALLNNGGTYGYTTHALVFSSQIDGAYTIQTDRDKLVNCIDGNFDPIVISSHGNK